MAVPVSKDMEVMVDLFLSGDFQPFVKRQVGTTVSDGFSCETEVVDEEEPPKSKHHRQVHNKAYINKCGQIFAKAGDEFFQHYATKKKEAPAEAPWQTISTQLRAVVVTASKAKGPDAEQEQEKAWMKFKGILENSISDIAVNDPYKYVGALLLTLHGLSNLAGGAIGLARLYFLRYFRERHLDATFERIGGLEGLVSSQEVD